jgi:hypothetical protein
MAEQRTIVGYDGPSGAYVIADDHTMPLSDPRAMTALVDSALLTGLGYSEKAAEYQKLAQSRNKRVAATK